MSVYELVKKGFEVGFKSERVTVGKNWVYVRGDKIDSMYCIAIDDGNIIINSSYVLESKFNKIDSYVWHLRLGHINKDKMKRKHKKMYNT